MKPKPLVRLMEKLWTKPGLTGDNDGSDNQNAAFAGMFSMKLRTNIELSCLLLRPVLGFREGAAC